MKKYYSIILLGCLIFGSQSHANAQVAYQSLFNGRDLTGWVGDLDSHEVRGGLLVSLPGKGNLFTKKEYGDFVLDFEFKLSEGANHGIAIRSPRTGITTKDGFEIQILDDSAKRYAGIKSTAYHGSIFKCVAAKRGHLKPVGQWNKQRIRAVDNVITVTLNGVIIIDKADVSSYGRQTKGHIGLLGWGDSQVAFRAIKIQPIKTQPIQRSSTPASSDDDSGLHVYAPVPGLKPSDKYQIKVRLLGSRTWQDPFAFITRSKVGTPFRSEPKNAYSWHLDHWTHTYVNFEMNKPVEIAIRKADGTAIRKAAAHSQHKYRSCKVRNGVAYLIMDEPGLIAVDIDGQMDDQDTGSGYKGPPLHAVTIFGNPFLKDRPSVDDSSVHTVKPGEKPPTQGSWSTLYFLPGVHEIGVGFQVHANKSYYIPGDAIIYGTFHNNDEQDGHHIRIHGHGTISGARLAHPKFAKPRQPNHSLHYCIWIEGADYNLLDGVTIADPAAQAKGFASKWVGKGPSHIQWSKVISWRGNGDGLGAGYRGIMEDCFMRCNDDCTYVMGHAIRRVTFWNDVNGAALVMEWMEPQPGVKPTVVEDCDVIYSRALWPKNPAGCVFSLRAIGRNATGEGVVFRNIRVSDPRTTKQTFKIVMERESWGRKRGPGDLSGILFQNIHIAEKNVSGLPDILIGMEDGLIRDITFDNVTIGGKKIRSINHFRHNEYVKDIKFK
ncbi:DUF1080 domain-containing protein [uncultured Gimesia sp.]|uniref:3-keto-disaccharide hydrolase n=1 Tax=uncultured Gimesia sp. TaxID=1678688 RepID=UPI0030DD7AA2|tara:strand:- start:36764 stop:38911 length:2148 start_codon:yes stop_codon:yes gene_type:complete